MKKETKENLKKVLLSCAPEELKCIFETRELENVKIQIQDRQDPMCRAIYKFVPYEDRFVEQTGTASYMPTYDPEEFVKIVEEFHYLVSIKVA